MDCFDIAQRQCLNSLHLLSQDVDRKEREMRRLWGDWLGGRVTSLRGLSVPFVTTQQFDMQNYVSSKKKKKKKVWRSWRADWLAEHWTTRKHREGGLPHNLVISNCHRMTDVLVLGSDLKPSTGISESGVGETQSRTEPRTAGAIRNRKPWRHCPGWVLHSWWLSVIRSAKAPAPALPLYALVWSGLGIQPNHTGAFASSSCGSGLQLVVLTSHASFSRLVICQLMPASNNCDLSFE